MTVQIHENLMCGNARYTFRGEPLADYFTLGGTNPGFRWQSTACWRGYIGTWELCEGRLYLIALTDYLSLIENCSSTLSLATLFPDYPARAFAHWYSGTLLIPLGQNSRHMSHSSPNPRERTLLLSFERGHLQSAWLKYNELDEEDMVLEIADAVAILESTSRSVEDEA